MSDTIDPKMGGKTHLAAMDVADVAELNGRLSSLFRTSLMKCMIGATQRMWRPTTLEFIYFMDGPAKALVFLSTPR